MSAGRVACCRDVKDYDERKESGTPLQMVRTSSGIPSRKSTTGTAVYVLTKKFYTILSAAAVCVIKK